MSLSPYSCARDEEHTADAYAEKMVTCEQCDLGKAELEVECDQ